MHLLHDELVRERNEALLREAEEVRRVVRAAAVRRARLRADRASARLQRALAQLNSLL